MNENALYVLATVQRAYQEGQSSVVLNTADMMEICNMMQRLQRLETINKPARQIGWASPFQLGNLLKKRRDTIPMRRKKSSDHCVPVFFTGDLEDHRAESARLCAKRDARRQEVEHVPATVS